MLLLQHLEHLLLHVLVGEGQDALGLLHFQRDLVFGVGVFRVEPAVGGARLPLGLAEGVGEELGLVFNPLIWFLKCAGAHYCLLVVLLDHGVVVTP